MWEEVGSGTLPSNYQYIYGNSTSTIVKLLWLITTKVEIQKNHNRVIRMDNK